MDWPLLEEDPRVGDVLYHGGSALEPHDMIVVVLRSYMEDHKQRAVDVFWICGGNEHVSTHYGRFSSWKTWRRL